MLYRLVRPVKRKDTRNRQFIRRIPADLRERMAGVRLAIPVGGMTVPILITPHMESIRVSLRTDSPEVVKLRQAEPAAYVEKVFSAYRHDQPVPLSHRQAVALSGELYRRGRPIPTQAAE